MSRCSSISASLSNTIAHMGDSGSLSMYVVMISLCCGFLFIAYLLSYHKHTEGHLPAERFSSKFSSFANDISQISSFALSRSSFVNIFFYAFCSLQSKSTKHSYHFYGLSRQVAQSKPTSCGQCTTLFEYLFLHCRSDCLTHNIVAYDLKKTYVILQQAPALCARLGSASGRQAHRHGTTSSTSPESKPCYSKCPVLQRRAGCSSYSLNQSYGRAEQLPTCFFS